MADHESGRLFAYKKDRNVVKLSSPRGRRPRKKAVRARKEQVFSKSVALWFHRGVKFGAYTDKEKLRKVYAERYEIYRTNCDLQLDNRYESAEDAAEIVIRQLYPEKY